MDKLDGIEFAFIYHWENEPRLSDIKLQTNRNVYPFFACAAVVRGGTGLE